MPLYCKVPIAEWLVRLAFYHRSGASQVGGSKPGGDFFNFFLLISIVMKWCQKNMNVCSKMYVISHGKLSKSLFVSTLWLFNSHVLKKFCQNCHFSCFLKLSKASMVLEGEKKRRQKNIEFGGIRTWDLSLHKNLGTRLTKISLKIHNFKVGKFKQDFLTNLCPHWPVVSSHTKIVTEFHRIFLCTVLCSTQ